MTVSASKNTSVRVAALQMQCVADKQTNLDRAAAQIREAASQGAQVICLQELFHGLYPCQTEDHDRFDEAETIPGLITQSMSDLARELGIVLVVSMFEKRAAGLYHNTALVYDTDGSSLGMYRKMHIPDDPLYYEKFYFTPGDLGFKCFDSKYGKIGVCVCWDQWFPEAARLTALTGAEILVYPTAIGWHPSEKAEFGTNQYSAWQTMMRSHAIANGLYVIAPNRVGMEGNIEFWGGSFIVDPYGALIAHAAHDHEAILTADCDLSLINTARTHWPFLRDRRIDAYGGLTKRFLDRNDYE
ncbi:MAG: carbon-nitrogen hydrolase [Planctomycetaceae bacterium]|nr:carbon-nitrogen hydrolase [Planctomycetaceae bacterium]